MGYQNQRRALFTVQIEHSRHDFLARSCIQVAGRFIGKDDLRIDNKCARNCYTLLFTSGELTWVVLEALAQPDTFENFPASLTGIVAASQFQWQHDVFQRRQRRQQLKGLKHEADPVPPDTRPPVFVHAGQIVPVGDDATGTWYIQTCQQRKQRCLSRPRSTDHRERFPVLDIK